MELATALNQGNVRNAKLALQHGADINATDEEGRTPLMDEITMISVGTEQEALPLLRLLLAEGATVHHKDKFGLTALNIAAGEDSPRTVKLLLKKGASVNDRDSEGQTALMAAAYSVGEATTYASPDTIKILLQHGADINARDNQGQTALIWAAQLEGNDGSASYIGDVESARVVKLLLARGASVNIRSRNGNTALKWARAKGHPITMKLLRRAGATEVLQLQSHLILPVTRLHETIIDTKSDISHYRGNRTGWPGG